LGRSRQIVDRRLNAYAKAAALWTRDQLNKTHQDFLSALPLTITFEHFAIAHGTFHQPEAFNYIQTVFDAQQSFAALRDLGAKLGFLGHSHVPVGFFDTDPITYTLDQEIPVDDEVSVIVNAGSVGQPRDENNKASYALFDTDSKTGDHPPPRIRHRRRCQQDPPGRPARNSGAAALPRKMSPAQLPVRVKFCGFTRAEDVSAAVNLGVDALGFNLARGPRKITAQQAGELTRLILPFTTSVALFIDADETQILEALRISRCQVVQLHGDESPELAAALRRRVPVIKAFRIASIADLHKIGSYPADAYLLDAAVPGQHGGTGTAWDWSLLADLHLHAPFLLAGGLRPDTVAAAIAHTHPWAVDVSSSIESAPGIKDVTRMQAFVANARR